MILVPELPKEFTVVSVEAAADSDGKATMGTVSFVAGGVVMTRRGNLRNVRAIKARAELEVADAAGLVARAQEMVDAQVSEAEK